MPVTPSGGPPFAQHPSGFAFSGDASALVAGLAWRGWGTPTATARGTLHLEGDCIPSCAKALVYSYPVTVTASELAKCPRDGHAIYTLVIAHLRVPDYTGHRTYSNRVVSCSASH